MMPNAIPECGAGNGDASSEICRSGPARMTFRRVIQQRATPLAISIRQSEKEPTMKFIKNFLCEEEGVTAIEYGLIAALVGVVIVSSVTLLGAKLNEVFNNVVIKLGPGA
jgi:pilus assembly protein Flp/PilA